MRKSIRDSQKKIKHFQKSIFFARFPKCLKEIELFARFRKKGVGNFGFGGEKIPTLVLQNHTNYERRVICLMSASNHAVVHKTF